MIDNTIIDDKAIAGGRRGRNPCRTLQNHSAAWAYGVVVE